MGSSRSRRFGEIDRFIPVRSAIDWDFARSQLTAAGSNHDSAAASSSSRWGPYGEILTSVLLNGKRRILSFNNNALSSSSDSSSSSSSGNFNPRRKSNVLVTYSPDRVLDAPGLIDDPNLNLLDWGSTNLITIALENVVHIWNPSDGSSASELVTVQEDMGPVTSLSWAADGCHIAVGLNNSDVQLWDATSNLLLRTLRGLHGSSRVGSLAWNDNVLTTGGGDGCVVNNDVRLRSSVVQRYRGHRKEICGLKWSGSGQKLASGGNDGLVHIWDLAACNRNQWVFRFSDHGSGCVRALSWCPLRNNMLATGGGEADGSIKFWNTGTGTCINSVQTGRSQVCALVWNKNKQEILSSCGGNQDQLLTLWEYPSMGKIGRLVGHANRVISLAQSPDGYTVASGSGGVDETLRLWHVFSPMPEARGAFTNSPRIQIRSY